MRIINRTPFIIFLFTAVAMQAQPDYMRVMTYNIRYENASDTGDISWQNRKQFIASTILFHKADIIGMQEVLHNQLVWMDTALPDFTHAGVGREDGNEKGEYAPVYFNNTIFEKINDSTFWLSSTPGIVSKGWDAALERICTWVKLKDKRNGKIFFVFNTHFDHRGEIARTESAKLILTQLKRIAGELPVILTGDLNTFENTAPIKILTGKTGTPDYKLSDAMHISLLPHHGSYKTFCGFNLMNGVIGDRIDYIFVSSRFKVRSHATLTDFTGNHFPSDHFPVLSEIILN